MIPEVEAAVQAYLSKMTSAEVARSDAYFEGGYWIQLWSLLIGLAMSWLLLKFGVIRRMRDTAERANKRPWLQDSAFVLMFFVLTFILSLPWDAYTQFFREKAYGLQNQTAGAWFLDHLKGMGIGVVIGVLMVVLLFKIIRRLPNSWWFWGTLTTGAVFFLMIMLMPIYLMPVFNKYQPLAPGPVRDMILQMAHSNGIPAEEVYQFDASKQSNRVSANVSGLGQTMRISLNDNLLNRSTPEEIKAVMGHEMGHYVMNHIPKMIVFLTLIFGFVYAIIWSVSGRLVARFGPAWGIRSTGDIAALPVYLMVFSVCMFIATPIQNTIVRVQEVEADMYGFNVAREPDGAAAVYLKLAEYRKMKPGFWEEFIFFDHPSGENRIRAAMTWKHFQTNK